MRLRDLADIPRPGADNAPSLTAFTEVLGARGIDWPAPVIEQFLYDHAGRDDYIELYDHLQLEAIKWELAPVPTSEILRATTRPDFDRHDKVAANAHPVVDLYRRSHGPDVWTDTWKVPPVAIVGALCHPPQEPLHWLEGHTRLGVLLGMVADSESVAQIHQVWIGS